MSGGASSPFEYQFKIADLGTSHFKRVTATGDQKDISTIGTLAYGRIFQSPFFE
jgi:hypothetical protein